MDSQPQSPRPLAAIGSAIISLRKQDDRRIQYVCVTMEEIISSGATTLIASMEQLLMTRWLYWKSQSWGNLTCTYPLGRYDGICGEPLLGDTPGTDHA